MKLKKRWVLFLASGGGVGFSPIAPGTWGTAAALVPCYFFSLLSTFKALGVLVLFILFAIWVAHRAERILGKKDAGCIVIDEFAGILTTFVSIEFTVDTAIAAFLLFRTIDILKPPPIRFMERKIPGGAGVVLDDVMAGIYANLILRFFVAIWSII